MSGSQQQLKPRLRKKEDAVSRPNSDNDKESSPGTSEPFHTEMAASNTLSEQQGAMNNRSAGPGLDRVGLITFPGKGIGTINVRKEAAVSAEAQVPYGVSSSSSDPAIQDGARPGAANVVKPHHQQWFDGRTTRHFVGIGAVANVGPLEQQRLPVGSVAAATAAVNNLMGAHHFSHHRHLNLGAVFGRTPSAAAAGSVLLRTDHRGQTVGAPFLNSNDFASNNGSSPGNNTSAFVELTSRLPIGEASLPQQLGYVGLTSDTVPAFYNVNSHDVRLPFMRPAHEQSAASHRQSSASDLQELPQALHPVAAVPTPQWGIVPSLTPAQLRMQDALSDDQLRNMTADDLR